MACLEGYDYEFGQIIHHLTPQYFIPPLPLNAIVFNSLAAKWSYNSFNSLKAFCHSKRQNAFLFVIPILSGKIIKVELKIGKITLKSKEILHQMITEALLSDKSGTFISQKWHF